MQIIEKLPGNGYKNGSVDCKMFEYHVHREDLWMKTLRTSYSYERNEKTKSMKKNVPVGKLSPLLPRYRERYLSTRIQNNIDK